MGQHGGLVVSATALPQEGPGFTAEEPGTQQKTNKT